MEGKTIVVTFSKLEKTRSSYKTLYVTRTHSLIHRSSSCSQKNSDGSRPSDKGWGARSQKKNFFWSKNKGEAAGLPVPFPGSATGEMWTLSMNRKILFLSLEDTFRVLARLAVLKIFKNKRWVLRIKTKTYERVSVRTDQ